MTYRRRKTSLRMLSPQDAAAIRSDYTARTLAKSARRHGLHVLRTVPTLRQHAARTGVSLACLKQLVAGVTYKDLP